MSSNQRQAIAKGPPTGLGYAPTQLSVERRDRPIEDVRVDWERFVARPRPVVDLAVVWNERLGA